MNTPQTPELSLVVLQWNNLELTKRCVASLRENTLSTHELIVVDNGSTPEASSFALAAADKAVLHESNLGFAGGMNSGLAVSSGRIVAFINNDTTFPIGWDEGLLDHLADEGVGLVAPAVSAAGNPVTVRAEPTDEVVRLLPFGEFPSGVVYLLRRQDIIALGGWNERYPVASSEDLDLCFTVWANGLDIILDTHTVIDHVSQASVRLLPEREALYERNLRAFLNRWRDPIDVPRLEHTEPEAHATNLARAQTAVQWIERMLDAREEVTALRGQLKNARTPINQPVPRKTIRARVATRWRTWSGPATSRSGLWRGLRKEL